MARSSSGRVADKQLHREISELWMLVKNLQQRLAVVEHSCGDRREGVQGLATPRISTTSLATPGVSGPSLATPRVSATSVARERDWKPVSQPSLGDGPSILGNHMQEEDQQTDTDANPEPKSSVSTPGHTDEYIHIKKLEDLCSTGDVLSMQQEDDWQSGTAKPSPAEEPTKSVTVEWRGEEHFHIKNSTWDLLFLAGIDDSRVSDGILTVVAAVCTCGMQVLFILIVASMTVELFGRSSLDQLLMWRLVEGHSYHNYHEDSGTSLVARVCEEESLMLTSSTVQAQLKATLNTALGQGQDGALQNLVGSSGGVESTTLCLVCLVMWSVHLCHELELIIGTLRALSITRGPTTIVIESDGKHSIKQLSRSRCLFILMFNVIPRCLVLVGLGTFGTLFLANTVSLSDLLLNAVALNFILDIDQMLSWALVPNPVLFAQQSLKPIPLCRGGERRSVLYRWIDCPVLLRYLLVVVTLLGAFILVRADLDEQMQAAYDIMCGFDRNFIYAVDISTGVVMVSRTEVRDGELMKDATAKRKYEFKAVAQRAGLVNLPAFRERFDITSWATLSSDLNVYYEGDRLPRGIEQLRVFAEDYDDWIAPNSLYCLDQSKHHWSSWVVDQPEEFWIGLRQQLVGTPADIINATTEPYCGRLADLCDAADERVRFTARRLCPETCRCPDPLSGYYQLRGCAPHCVTELRERRDQWLAEHGGCANASDPEPADLPPAFFKQFQDMDTRAAEPWVVRLLGHLSHLEGSNFTMKAALHGCRLLTDENLVDELWEFCWRTEEHDNSYGDFDVFCPHACGRC